MIWIKRWIKKKNKSIMTKIQEISKIKQLSTTSTKDKTRKDSIRKCSKSIANPDPSFNPLEAPSQKISLMTSLSKGDQNTIPANTVPSPLSNHKVLSSNTSVLYVLSIAKIKKLTMIPAILHILQMRKTLIDWYIFDKTCEQ